MRDQLILNTDTGNVTLGETEYKPSVPTKNLFVSEYNTHSIRSLYSVRAVSSHDVPHQSKACRMQGSIASGLYAIIQKANYLHRASVHAK